MKLYITNEVAQKISQNLKMLIFSILENKMTEENVDYLQIFEVKDKVLTVRQEQPEKSKNYQLETQEKDTKLWGILNKDEKGEEYWTILFPDEY